MTPPPPALRRRYNISTRILALPTALLALTMAEGALASQPTDQDWKVEANCPTCEVGAVRTLALPFLNQIAYSAKLLDPSTGDAIRVTLTDTLVSADEDDLFAANEAARAALYGKKSPELAQLMAQRTPTDRIEVAILTTAAGPVVDKATLTTQAQLDTQVMSVYNAIQPVHDAVRSWLSANEGFIRVDSSLAPVIMAQVENRLIPGLEALSEVQSLDLSGWPGVTGSDRWRSTITTPTGSFPANSAGRVCAVEPLGVHDTTFVPIVARASPGARKAEHMTRVLGIVRNEHPFPPNPRTSITRSTLLYDGAFDGFVRPIAGPQNTDEWCMRERTYVINRSYAMPRPGSRLGVQSLEDVRIDKLVEVPPYSFFSTMAGNIGGESGPGDQVLNLNYNALVVGGMDDKGTAATSDDTIYASSRFRDPSTAGGDFEFPHLVAPANAIGVANLPGNVPGAMGTSFSTPMVSATASLVQERDPTTAYFWPEMTRSVILATATRNVDGNILQWLHGTGDAKDGVGLLDVNRAVQLADPANYRQPGAAGASRGRFRKTLTWSQFNGRGWSNDRWNITATATGRMRVVLSWSSIGRCSGLYNDCRDALADLDLAIIQTNVPNGNLYPYRCLSQSFENAWEVCDFTVQAGDTFQVAAFFTNGSPKGSLPRSGVRVPNNGTPFTWMGLAWFQY